MWVDLDLILKEYPPNLSLKDANEKTILDDLKENPPPDYVFEMLEMPGLFHEK